MNRLKQNKMRKVCFTLFTGVALLVLQACSSSSSELKKSVISYIAKQQDVTVFGKVDLFKMMDKSKLENFPKIGPVVRSYLQLISSGINLESPIYMTCSGPFDRDGKPKEVVIFMDVQDKDSLINAVTRQGYDLNEKGKISYVGDNQRGVSIGITESLAILTVHDGTHSFGEVADIFKACKLKKESEKVDDILSRDGDVICGVSLQNLYTTSNTVLNNLASNRKREINRMVSNSYVGYAFHFDDGELRIEMNQLFNDFLSDLMFIERENKPEEIADQLGSGHARMGVSMNLDLKKLENFISTIDPSSMIQMKESFAGLLGILGIPTKSTDSMSSLFTGQLGLVVLGGQGITEGLSEMNVFIGLEKRGNSIASQSKNALNGFVPGVKLKPQGLSVYSELKNNKDGQLNIPEFGNEFGQHGINLFVDAEKLNLNQFELAEAGSYLKLIKSIHFYLTNEKGELVIKLKKPTNVLNQITQTALDDLSKKIAL